MATITIATNGRASLLAAYRELARRLREAGHRVVIVTGVDVAERITDADRAGGERPDDVVGLDHDRRFEEEAAADPPPSPTDPLAVVRWLGRRRRLRARSIDGAEIREAVVSTEPDLVIVDAEFQVGLLATADLATPRVLAMTFFSIFAGPDLPPISTGLGAPTGPADRARVRLAWRRLRIEAVAARARRRLSRGGLAALVRPMRLDSNDLADLRPLARRCGVDLRATTDRSQWLRPHLVRDLPVLCFNAAELDLPHTPSPRLHYLGPLIGTAEREPELAGDDGQRWEALIAARREADRAGAARRPLVYATLGTLALGDRSLLDRIVATFARRPEWDLVLGLGGVLDPADLAPLPDNVLALPWAPQLRVMAEADAVISHGGTGTLREAVATGTPSVVFPTGHGANDQHGTARRTAHHRLGLIGDTDGASSTEIEATVAAVLADPDIADGVAEMARVVDRYAEEGRAVAAIEALLARPPTGAERLGTRH